MGDGTVDGVRSTTSKTQRGDAGGSSAFEFGGNEVEARDTVRMGGAHTSTLSRTMKSSGPHMSEFLPAPSAPRTLTATTLAALATPLKGASVSD